MRKWFALILVLGLTLSLAACGKSQKSDYFDEPVVPDSPLIQGIVAAEIGNRELSNVEFTYFYVDAIHKYCDQYADYLSYFIDVTKPLNEQIYNQETGKTWADAFLDMALVQAQQVYALYDAAVAAGHQLSVYEMAEVNATFESMEAVAKEKGYLRPGDYLQAYYGFGASVRTYQEYYERLSLAQSYYSAYHSNLANSYTKDDFLAYEQDRGYLYNSYSYLRYFVDVADFEDHTAAEDAAKALAVESNDTEKKLNKAIGKVLGKADVCKAHENEIYNQVDMVAREWLADPQRQEGDIAYFPKYQLLTEAEDDFREILTGYVVVVFQNVNDNRRPLVNVRHILITNEDASPMEKAEQILEQWRKGEKTEGDFGNLANQYSQDPGSNTLGGLYENIVPGQMVAAFDAWCFDSKRESGDTGIVETEYGVHVMYFSGYSDLTFRDYMVRTELLEKDMKQWDDEIMKATPGTIRDDSKLAKDLVIEDMVR